MHFLRDGMNDLLCLKFLFGNFGWTVSTFNKEKFQEQKGGNYVFRMQRG